jgi:hypothetical protein
VEVGDVVATDLPHRREPAEYEQAVAEYVSRVSRQPGVLGIYQIGSIGTPGVSDIDLVVLLEEDLRTVDPRAFDIAEASPETRYLFMHRPFIVNRGAAPSLHLHYRIEHIRLVWGTIPPAEAFADSTARALEKSVQLAVTTDFAVDLAAQFQGALITRHLSVRGMLCLLLSLRHTIAGAKALGLPTIPGHDAYEQGVLRLRAECFNLPKAELVARTMRMVGEGAWVALEILEILGASVLARDEYLGSFARRMPTEVLSPVLVLSPKSYGVFTDPYGAGRALARALSASRDTTFRLSPARLANRLLLFLPKTLYYQFAAYASQGGRVGRQIRARLRPSVGEPGAPSYSEYEELLRARAALANVQAEFLSRHRFDFGQLLLNEFTTPAVPQGLVRRTAEAIQIRALQRTRLEA